MLIRHANVLHVFYVMKPCYDAVKIICPDGHLCRLVVCL